MQLIKLKKTSNNYLLTIPEPMNQRAEKISSGLWDSQESVWIYPRNEKIYFSLKKEFGEEWSDMVSINITTHNALNKVKDINIFNRKRPASEKQATAGQYKIDYPLLETAPEFLKQGLKPEECTDICNFSQIIDKLKGKRTKFKICVLGDISDANQNLKNSVSDYFTKIGVRANQWELYFISNKKMKNRVDIAKKFKKNQSGFSIVITAQLHNHSTKGNKSQNIFTELNKPIYIDRIGQYPRKKPTIDNIIKWLDDYLNRRA
jgi:Holliday junction resolvase RusA-like endonuclease